MTKEELIQRYQEKMEAKRERLAARAARKRAEAEAAGSSARTMLDIIPPGQPILVGHHSEKRHRRDLERIDNNMRKSFEASKQAARLQNRADNFGSGSISSDDPEAIDKLRDKLADLEAKRERIKTENRKARKEGGEPHPRYVLSNLGGNIRRVKQRIALLEEQATHAEAEPIVGDGFRIEEDAEANRVRFYFDERPSREICKRMRRWGFKWAPSVGAWQRQLNSRAVYMAKELARDIFGWDGLK